MSAPCSVMCASVVSHAMVQHLRERPSRQNQRSAMIHFCWGLEGKREEVRGANMDLSLALLSLLRASEPVPNLMEAMQLCHNCCESVTPAVVSSRLQGGGHLLWTRAIRAS